MVRIAFAGVLLGAAGCSDYGYAKSDESGTRGGADRPPRTENTTPDDTAWTPGVDTANTGDTGTDPGTTPLACYEPEDGYESNPAARLIVTDASSAMTITFVSSKTAYQDDLWLDAPSSTFLVHAWQDPPGTVLVLGPFALESELIFGAEILTTGDHWQSGPASRNADGVVHVAVAYEGACSWLIGFEDLWGGGDLDYNDVVLRVQGDLRQDP